MDLKTLPNDPELLKAMVLQLAEERALLLSSNEKQAREIDKLKRQLFGKKSERTKATASDKLEKTDEPAPPAEVPAVAPETPAEPAAAPPAPKPPRRPPPPDKGNGRGRLPPKLTRVPVEAPLGEGSTCSRCGCALKVIGQVRSERLEWVPGHFIVLDIGRDKCVCPRCPAEGVRLAPPPPFAIDRALPGDGLLAKVLIDKFADNIPLTRQAKIFDRHGLHIAVPTMCGWMRACAGLLKHVVAAMRDDLLLDAFIETDATGLPVLDGDSGQAHRGALWVYGNDEQAVFVYSADHESKNPKAFLDGYKGTVVADGTPTLDFLGQWPDVDRAGCWSHARRYFFEARADNADDALIALTYIRHVFLVERDIREAEPAERVRVRQERTAPKLAAFRVWLDDRMSTAIPGSPTHQATRYTLERWDELTQFLTTGEIDPHNNRSERRLRNPVIGRKNWLFAGSEGGAHAAATFFSIVASCQLQAVDPWEYLTEVLSRLPDARPEEIRASLTPRAWAKARREATETA